MAQELTALFVRRATEPGIYRDTKCEGLALIVETNGRKWFRFTYRFAGKRPEMTLAANTLADARDEVAKHRAAIKRGENPVQKRKEAKRAAALAAASVVTFKKAADAYVQLKAPEWSARQLRDVRHWLDRHVYPTIGNIAVGDVGKPHIAKILGDLWRGQPVLANRIRRGVAAILELAMAREWRPEGRNPASKAVVCALMAGDNKDAQPVKPHAAIEWRRLPQAMTKLRQKRSPLAKPVEFTILCAARVSEVAGMRWREVNFERELWTIPGSRMKAGEEHTVPLSDRALEILVAVKPETVDPDALVFPSKGGEPFRIDSFRIVLHQLGYKKATIHGTARASFRSWAAAHGISRELAETALAHSIGSRTEQAYQRETMIELRRPLMQAWSDYLAGLSTAVEVSAFATTA